MSTPARMTPQTIQVLAALAAKPRSEHYSLGLARAIGLQPATVHAILTRFAQLGWLTCRWERIDPSEAGRQPRKLYKLTPLGVSGIAAVDTRSSR